MVHGPLWGDREELLAATVDRLGEALYLLQAIAGVKHPERIPPVPRPGINGQGTPAEMVEPPKMSTKAEIRAFFGMEGTKVVYSES